jgi:DNA polymerase III subunit alpha
LGHADFIHLRVHSAYSLSAGAIRIKPLVGLCKQQKMPAVAITDSGNLFGALEFAQACIDVGVQPIIGCELALRRAESAGGAGGGETRLARGGGPVPHAEPDRIILLVQSEAGYRNLSKLVSKSFLEDSAGEAPAVALADLAAHGDGLICLTGGPGGPVGRLLGEGQLDAA